MSDPQAGARFDRWAEAFAADWVRENPLLATVTQYFEGAEQDELDTKLALAGSSGEAIGAKAFRARGARARRGLEALQGFRPGELDATRRITARFLERRFRDAAAGAEFAANHFVFDQFNGLHVTLMTFLTTLHPLRDRKDAEHYLARLELVAACLDAGIAEAKDAAAAGASSWSARSPSSWTWRTDRLARISS